MVSNPSAVGGGRPLVGGDEHRIATIGPGIPGPGEVGDAGIVGPLHEILDPAARAVFLAKLRCHNRIAARHRPYHQVAERVEAWTGGAHVPRGRQLVRRSLDSLGLAATVPR